MAPGVHEERHRLEILLRYLIEIIYFSVTSFLTGSTLCSCHFRCRQLLSDFSNSMKLQTGATQVATRTAQLMRAGRLGHRSGITAIGEPTWFRVVLAHPPTHQLLPKLRQLKKWEEPDKIPSYGVYQTRNKKTFSTNPKHLYKLEKIRFEEDNIRKLFYTNHPWELARPRSLVENEADLYKRRDWSSMVQPGLALCGESVVQRTLWLSEQPEYKAEHGTNWKEAYVQARLEFYRLRIREQAEADVAAEEAIMLGAILDNSAIQYGLEQEQRVIDQYIVDAEEASRQHAAQSQKAAEEKEDNLFEETPEPTTEQN